MKVVIMAGGKGTRISSVASDIPKPMIKVEGIPVLEREIECLREQGFTDIIITVSHLGQIIMDYFGDGSGNSPTTGRPFGVHIEYYFEKEPLGNAGALFKIKDKLTSDFLLLNADAMFDVDFNRFVAFHRKHGGLVTLFTHPNSHPYDSGLIIANKNGLVEKWLTKEDERPTYYKNRVNAHRTGSGLEPCYHQPQQQKEHAVLYRRVPPPAERGTDRSVQCRDLEAVPKMGWCTHGHHPEHQGSACQPGNREYLREQRFYLYA